MEAGNQVTINEAEIYEAFAKLARQVRGGTRPTDWVDESGVPRTQWLNWEKTGRFSAMGPWMLAEVMGIPASELVARISSENYVDTEGRPLPELGRDLDALEFRELNSLCPDDELLSRIQALTAIIQERRQSRKQAKKRET